MEVLDILIFLAVQYPCQLNRRPHLICLVGINFHPRLALTGVALGSAGRLCPLQRGGLSVVFWRGVKVLYKPFESRREKCLSSALLLCAMRSQCAPQAT